jgi:hypothetical protein
MPLLQERIQALLDASPDETKDYYALTIFLGERGTPEYTCFSGWAGYTDEQPRREIREASLVHADRMMAAWKDLGEPGMVVDGPADFALFFARGGHAIVESTLAEFVVPEWLAPRPMVHVGEWGYASPATLPSSAMQRAPTPKLRMTVLKRDDLRCRICGRRPSDHVDVELHVHHVRPWAIGGVTEESNLITLCHTCHKGLDPHYEHGLFALLKTGRSTDRTTSYEKKLAQYQAAAAMVPSDDDV